MGYCEILSKWMIMSRMYICICNAITEREVRECAGSGACSVDDLASRLGLGAGCGRCRECAADMLKEITAKLQPRPVLAGE